MWRKLHKAGPEKEDIHHRDQKKNDGFACRGIREKPEVFPAAVPVKSVRCPDTGKLKGGIRLFPVGLPGGRPLISRNKPKAKKALIPAGSGPFVSADQLGDDLIGHRRVIIYIVIAGGKFFFGMGCQDSHYFHTCVPGGGDT